MSAMTDLISADRPTFVARSREEQEIEAREKRPIDTILRDLYHGPRRLNQQAIAEELGVTRQTVIGWMQKHGIPTAYNRSEGTAP